MILQLICLSEANEIAAVVLKVMAAEDPIALHPAMMQNKCDLEGRPVGCDTFHWKYQRGQASPPHQYDHLLRDGYSCTMMGILRGVECYPRR